MRRKRILKKFKGSSKVYELRLRPKYRKDHGIVGLYCIYQDCCFNSSGRKNNTEEDERSGGPGICLNTWKDLKTDESQQCCSCVFKGSPQYLRKQFTQMFKIGDLVDVPVTLLDGRILDIREKRNMRQVRILQILPHTCVVADILGKHRFTRSIGFNDLISAELLRRERIVEAER